ncbi:hypothetical protein [Beijerinckia mobilis]|uniref:hypothetical protein n=1 Tax=Beijerinckia mobilis TaxID=231434 RepID=UPI000557A49A|nr:hypothetical protein [Beijerinckia mobilis]
MRKEPFSDHCSNPNRDDHWTCPACYKDLGNVGEHTIICPDCGNKILCTIEYEPACHARLADQDDEETN